MSAIHLSIYLGQVLWADNSVSLQMNTTHHVIILSQ